MLETSHVIHAEIQVSVFKLAFFVCEVVLVIFKFINPEIR